ncbi:HlyU family transcriptional regulator [Polycladidibacter stylochi]|uniref:HlyU family transcriptional regulator n=1 Tax=Polycladidibacter stylochi TaxID=1807766 RepID=UPI000833577A|nr:HlyU family transcriptional regulator [Pseudovibrio stylochi]
MSLFSRLFAGKQQPEKKQKEVYKGFEIQPNPAKRGGTWQTQGIITKQIDGENKQHEFIRADTHATKEEAQAHSLRKAKQIIDELGEDIFNQA